MGNNKTQRQMFKTLGCALLVASISAIKMAAKEEGDKSQECYASSTPEAPMRWVYETKECIPDLSIECWKKIGMKFNYQANTCEEDPTFDCVKDIKMQWNWGENKCELNLDFQCRASECGMMLDWETKECVVDHIGNCYKTEGMMWDWNTNECIEDPSKACDKTKERYNWEKKEC